MGINSIIGQSPQLENLLRSAGIVAATDANVLLLGESGTGKELLAEELHHQGQRKARAFVAVNCAALPDELAEAELFGYRKGAFTGAGQDYDGRLAQADGGTLFLDEVGELSLKVQAKLLRFLESGECQPLGSNANRHLDVRVIAATNRDLQREVETGNFRGDLYYRLNIVPLELPPLRERSGDIPLLIQHFVEGFAGQYGLAAPTFDRQAMTTLLAYAWPGNVRELRNFCERSVILLQGQTIGTDQLPREMRQPTSCVHGGFQLPEDGISLEVLEQEMIRQALDKSSGNRSRAARLLGLTRDTLNYRLKKYSIA
jgi:transcriptional regulator with GAF, ATPase, and Fis domain